MQIHGYMIEATWDGDTLTVNGTTKAARVALRGQDHGDGPLVLTRDDMATVTVKDASALVNGRVTITTTTGAKHILHFRKKQSGDFTELANALGATRS